MARELQEADHVRLSWAKLCVQAVACQNLDKFDQAESDARAATELSSSKLRDLPEFRAASEGLLGAILIAKGDLKVAQQSFRTARSSAESILDDFRDPLLAAAYIGLGLLLINESKVDKAKALLEKARNLLGPKKPAYRRVYADALLASTSLHFSLRQYDLSLKYASEVVALLEEDEDLFLVELADARAYSGLSLFLQKKDGESNDEAKVQLDGALRNYDALQIPAHELKVAVINCLGSLYWQQDDSKSALSYYDWANELMSQAYPAGSELNVESLIYYGNCYVADEDLKRAQSLFRSALRDIDPAAYPLESIFALGHLWNMAKQDENEGLEKDFFGQLNRVLSVAYQISYEYPKKASEGDPPVLGGKPEDISRFQQEFAQLKESFLSFIPPQVDHFTQSTQFNVGVRAVLELCAFGWNKTLGQINETLKQNKANPLEGAVVSSDLIHMLIHEGQYRVEGNFSGFLEIVATLIDRQRFHETLKVLQEVKDSMESILSPRHEFMAPTLEVLARAADQVGEEELSTSLRKRVAEIQVIIKAKEDGLASE